MELLTVSLRLLQFCCDQEFLRCIVVLDPQDVGLATDLAVFDVGLAASSGFVDRVNVPLTAGGALETRVHRWGELISAGKTALSPDPYNERTAFGNPLEGL